MDRAGINKIIVGLMFFSGLCLSLQAQAQEEMAPVSVSMMPFKYVSVTGDAQKFRAVNWMNDGYEYGLKDLSFSQAFKNGLGVDLQGHSLPNSFDNGVDLTVSKSNFGYIKTKYDSFRKYYDGTGGAYYPFTTYRVTTLEDDLKMDMQNFLVEVGSHDEKDPGVSASFERHTKDGRKSRLAWTAVKEGAVTRDSGPSWQDVNEITDTLALKANTEMAGVKLSGEQKFEFFHADSLREEKNLTTDAGLNSANKMRRQLQRPETDLFTTLLHGEKWFLDEKNFVSMGYRYTNLDNSENETLTEYKADGTLFNYTSPKNRPNASANNKVDEHTLISSFMSNITNGLNFISKFKAETQRKHSTSIYPNDNNANAVPNGIINNTDVSTTKNSVYGFGENFSLRYNGIARTSLYTELELQQTRNMITEDRDSIAGESAADAAEQLSRQTRTRIQKTIVTTGARVVPNKYFNITTQLRHKMENNDFDDLNESVYSSGSKSAFFDGLKLKGDEASVKLAIKPINRVEGVARYQLFDNKFLSRAENQFEQKSRTLSHVFTYDLNLQPLDPWFLTMSYSKALNKTFTPAGSSSVFQLPGALSDVNNWLFSSSYALSEKINLTDSFLYTLANNYDDYTSSGLPLGASFKSYELTAGLQWNIKKDVSIEPHYSYYNYHANESIDANSYSANVVWVDVNVKW